LQEGFVKADDHQLVERQGVALVQSLTVTDLRWLFREQAVSDVGIDAQLEIVVNGRATGRLLALQIKSGDSYFREAVQHGFVYRSDLEPLDYWLNHSLPVFVVICKPGTGEAYWQVVSGQTVMRTNTGWKMVIPSANRFQADAVGRLQSTAAGCVLFPEEQRGELVTTERLTHPDLLPQELLNHSELFHKDRCVIEISSLAYTCCRIASLDEFLAVLVSTNSPDGTVLILHRAEGQWSIAAQVPVRTKYADSLPAFFVPGEPAHCFVIQHPTIWGTGTLLEEERWYLLSKEPRLILKFPLRGYVIGWGLLFDRQIDGACTTAPTELRSGSRMELAISARYSPSSDNPKYRGVRGVHVASTIRLEWQQSDEAFSLLQRSDISLDEAFDLYGDDNAGFVRRNLEALEALAEHPAEGVLSWLKDLAKEANTEQAEVLRRAISRRTV
jgi:hypothetical protein